MDSRERAKLPTSAFAEDVDDTSEAFAAVIPICLEATLDSIGVAVGQSSDDVAVFGDGELKIADNRAGIQAPVALGLRLDCSVPRAETGAGAGDREPMKVAVYLEDTALLAVIAFDVDELLVQSLQLLHDLHSVGLWQSGGDASSQAFKTTDDRIEFGRVLFCQRGDDHTALVGHSVLANITLLLELVEGGAYGSAADVQPFGKVAFDDPGSGGEFSVHDELSKLLEGRTYTGPVYEFGCADLHMIFRSGGGHRGSLDFLRRGHRLDCTINDRNVAIWKVYCGGFVGVAPGVPPSLPGFSPPLRPRVPGGCNTQRSEQSFPTELMDPTRISAGAEGVLAVRTPVRSTSWPISFRQRSCQ
jgi:hypothetical protein